MFDASSKQSTLTLTNPPFFAAAGVGNTVALCNDTSQSSIVEGVVPDGIEWRVVVQLLIIQTLQHWRISPQCHWRVESATLVAFLLLELLQPTLTAGESNKFNILLGKQSNCRFSMGRKKEVP